ncbi:MAG TPA: hypothetical protein VGN95_07205 [Pyrinomonadaceae bacterium]|jgi:hypothetical protein|nr:hypothetical protein [Pyrinomonadaceae bacterium]
MTKLRFADRVTTDEAHIQNGEYNRIFKRSEQPFEVTADELNYLLRVKTEIPGEKPKSFITVEMFTLVAEDAQFSSEGEQPTDGDKTDATNKKRANNKAQGN